MFQNEEVSQIIKNSVMLVLPGFCRAIVILKQLSMHFFSKLYAKNSDDEEMHVAIDLFYK